jgi:hypothetical protein
MNEFQKRQKRKERDWMGGEEALHLHYMAKIRSPHNLQQTTVSSRSVVGTILLNQTEGAVALLG